MTSQQRTETAGGAQLVGAPGRPARSADSERGQHDATSVLSWDTGAGPEVLLEDYMAQGRPARPRRFDDDRRNAAYWARIDRIVDASPPLADDQRAVIRTAFLAPASTSTTRSDERKEAA